MEVNRTVALALEREGKTRELGLAALKNEYDEVFDGLAPLCDCTGMANDAVRRRLSAPRWPGRRYCDAPWSLM